MGDAPQALQDFLAQLARGGELVFKRRDSRLGGAQQSSNLGIAFGDVGIATVVAFAKAVIQRLHQKMLTLGVVEQVVMQIRSEEHTSELQSLMRISYAVFCLKKKQRYNINDQLLDITK